MKKILLTGGSGFFCTRFEKHYKCKYEIVSTDSKEMDITDRDRVFEVINNHRPDITIHAGAVASTEFCDNNPEIAHKINVQGAINVTEAAKSIGAQMVFISTEQVFNGNEEPGPYNELSVPVPNTMYGKNKLEAEKSINDIYDKIWTVRFTWLFGLPEMNCGMSPNILWDTVKTIAKGDSLAASPTEYRGMTYSKYMVEQFDRIFDIPYGLYHLGSTNNLSRREVVEEITSNLGLGSLNIEPTGNGKYRDVRLSTEKIQSLGFDFKTTSDGIKECISDFKFTISR